MRKDEGLDRLADAINVAQFVAFKPSAAGLEQTYSRILGQSPNARFVSDVEAVAALFTTSGESSLNVRSYLPGDLRSKEFVYGLTSPADALAVLRRINSEGLFTIVNETVDVGDGGVSGVIQGDIVEFAPDATPRAVESADCASLPRTLGIALLESVFRFRPDIDVPRDTRLEFSLHPKPRGWLHRPTLGWEIEDDAGGVPAARLAWPNAFSRMIGDKAFGLLIAYHAGMLVPQTTVIGRRVAPFWFGSATGRADVWMRTCPAEQQPGRFTTTDGWTDPFAVLATEDTHNEVASVLSQAAIAAQWSGASHALVSGEIVVEGKRGSGEAFMMGAAEHEPLPDAVVSAVRASHDKASALGALRTEWAYDGERLWTLQLHLGAVVAGREVVSAGEAERWLDFDPQDGLPALRTTLLNLPAGTGVRLLRSVGMTSHVADTLRIAKVPAVIADDVSARRS